MVKQLQRQGTDISIETNNPGCMWGILRALQHQHWHHARKKMLRLRRHAGGRHSMGVGNSVDKIKAMNATEMQEPVAAEMNSHFVGEKVAAPIPVTKSSMKLRIKALIAEEMSKRRGRHRRSCSYPERVQLTRTDSIHHLEPSDSNKFASNDDSPRIIHQGNEVNPSASSSLDLLESKTCEEPVTSNTKCEFCELNITRQDLLLAETLGNAKEEEGVSFHKSKQFLDVFDIFNMNKELFMKVLQNPNPPLDHYYYGRKAFHSKMGFTKSMSFPCSKGGENTQFGTQLQKSAELEFSECIRKLKGNSSIGSPPALKNRQQNKVGIKRFKNIGQKIKQAMRESRKERHRITMDAVLHKIPYGWKFSKDEESAGLSRKSSPICEIDEKGGSPQIRRFSSFNESLDRYRQLYECSFNTEVKHHVSERLKLRTHETPSPSSTDRETLGRILSLPDLRSYCYFRSEDSLDTTNVGTPIRMDLNSNVGLHTSMVDERKTSCLFIGSENVTTVDASIEKGKSQKYSEKIGESDIVSKEEVGSESYEEVDGKVGCVFACLERLKSVESDAQQKNEIEVTTSPAGKVAEPSPISVLESSLEDINSPTKFCFSEEADSRLKPRSLFSDEPESLDSSVNKATMDSPTLDERIIFPENIETSIEQLNSEFLSILVNTKDAAEFNYVKYVLELSGYSKNELLGTWHSPDQPVDPSFFKEVEGCLVPKPHYPENEGSGNCSHRLLFDLINEVLLEIHDRSFTYWPKHLSSNSHIRPVPVGYHVLEEVWANISWYLSWKPEVDQSLDDSVTRDLAKGDGWMNLQFEAECVGLEIEDLIFEDLLEEIIWN